MGELNIVQKMYWTTPHHDSLLVRVVHLGQSDALTVWVEPRALDPSEVLPEGEFIIDNLLVRIHLIIEMILVDWPCAMGV